MHVLVAEDGAARPGTPLMTLASSPSTWRGFDQLDVDPQDAHSMTSNHDSQPGIGADSLLRASLASVLLATTLGIRTADAGTILVGKTPGVCTKHTLESAIEWANTLDGYNVIMVTDDAPGGEYRENVHVGNLKPGLRLEIRGGYRSCTDPTPSGERFARIRGAATGEPVLHLGGSTADVTLTGLHFSGGSHGIELDGPLTLRLRGDATSALYVTENLGDGIRLHFAGGDNASVRPTLDVAGRLGVWANGGAGIKAYDKALISIAGAGISITENGGHGIEIHSPAEGGIKGSGNVLASNAGYGLWIESTHSFSGFRSMALESIDRTTPLAISYNARGAIYMRAPLSDNAYTVSAQGVAIHHNNGRPIYAEGDGADLHINSTGCGQRLVPSTLCGSIAHNSTHNSVFPLIAAVDGARMNVENAWISDNFASSILSTNLGTRSAPSSITLSNSVVTANDVVDTLFESLNGGIVDIWESTVMRNIGVFGFSFVGIDPALLQATNSIIDQPQVLLTLEGDVSTTHFTRILARNRAGASAEDEILSGQPRYRDAFGRLEADSPGVDYAPPGGGHDFDLNPRDIDIASVQNHHGPRDLGAFEIPGYMVFHSGFE